jgi:hypothetical protein
VERDGPANNVPLPITSGIGTMMAREPVTHDVTESVASLELGPRAEALLRRNTYLALKNVTCEYQGGTLVLRGSVPTYYLKQVASAVVAGLPGIERIVNQIDVGVTARV